MSLGGKVLRVVAWTLIGAAAGLLVLFVSLFLLLVAGFGFSPDLGDALEVVPSFAVAGAVSGLLLVRDRERRVTTGASPHVAGGGGDDGEAG